MILDHPEADMIIYKLLQNDRHYKIADEDLDAIEDSRFRT